MADRFRASMVLAAAGDAMGYKKGDWEFCASTTKILKDLEHITGGKGILALDCTNWMVSDDTVEHLATAEGLVRALSSECTSVSLDQVMRSIARETKRCASDFTARAPGKSEQRGIKLIQADGRNWSSKPFDSQALGCGAAMRAACIGLVFSDPEHFPALVAVAVETCRLTKTHPTGYLGGVCAAAFAAFALRGVPVPLWGPRLIDEVIPLVTEYVLQPGQRHLKENEAALRSGAFQQKWQWFLEVRGLVDGTLSPTFPPDYGPSQRDQFYSQCAMMPDVNPSGKNPGARGYDSVLIAYDALLWVETQLGPESDPAARWAELCYHAVLHRGDNDSTGSIAGAWFGALHGFAGVPAKHYERIEYHGRCVAAGSALAKLATSAAKLSLDFGTFTKDRRHRESSGNQTFSNRPHALEEEKDEGDREAVEGDKEEELASDGFSTSEGEEVVEEKCPKDSPTETLVDADCAHLPCDDDVGGTAVDICQDPASSHLTQPVLRAARSGRGQVVAATIVVKRCGTSGCNRIASKSFPACCRTCVGSKGTRHGARCKPTEANVTL